MIRIFHNHTLQINPRRREEEPKQGRYEKETILMECHPVQPIKGHSCCLIPINYSPWARRGHHAMACTLRALCLGWYSIVHRTPRLRIKMLTLEILGPCSYFGRFSRCQPRKKTKRLYSVKISLLPSVMFTFMSRPSIFKIDNSISDIKN